MYFFIRWVNGYPLVVAWCTETAPETDIYEVQSEEDFYNCTNLSENPVHYSQDNDVEGFIVRPGLPSRDRFFVSKTQCKDGLKLRVHTGFE